jgi:hypothetical protein
MLVGLIPRAAGKRRGFNVAHEEAVSLLAVQQSKEIVVG